MKPGKHDRRTFALGCDRRVMQRTSSEYRAAEVRQSRWAIRIAPSLLTAADLVELERRRAKRAA